MKRWTHLILFTARAVLPALPALGGASAPKPPPNMPPELAAGFKAWSGKCGQCHAPERAYTAKYAQEKQIQALVSRMARKPGAAISRNDQKAIVAYLVWHAKDAAAAAR
jgi:hypothetical protein